jgi:PBP4 family serine-type D-alanyl-D-alanine carboxypeptidase
MLFLTLTCALSVNYGSIDIDLDETVKPPVLRLVPDTSYAALEYRIQVRRSKHPGRPEMTYQEYPWGDQYRIYGEVTDWDKRYHYLYLGVSRPGLYATTLFKEACVKQGIEITGSVQKDRVPDSAELLTSVTSNPLLEAVTVLNQKSKNIVAEMVNKHLGAVFVSVPGTREKGLSVIRQYCIDEIGLPKSELLFEDVSGLSANTRLSAKNFIRALNFFYQRTKLKDDFLKTLNRLTYRAGNHWLDFYVKTGTLSVSGVNSIVGYIILNKKNVFSFAILANRKATGTMTYSGTLTHPIIQSIIGAFSEI